MWKTVPLVLATAALLSATLALAASDDSASGSGFTVTVDADGPTPVGLGIKFLLRLYDDCSRRDGLTSCMKVKAATLLDRIARAGDIPLTDSLTLVRRDGSTRSHLGRAMSENELESTLPSESYEAKDAKLNDVLWERLAKVIASHSIQFSFPKMTASEIRGLSSGGGSGRGKMKGMMKMMMMGAAMGMMGMLPVMMGGVAMMALKALVVSKLALVLAIIMILKKLLSSGGGGGGGGGHSSGGGGGWSSGGGGGYGTGGSSGGWDRRAFRDDLGAHYMAYQGQTPTDPISSNTA